jgi:hypothetical protein
MLHKVGNTTVEVNHNQPLFGKAPSEARLQYLLTHYERHTDMRSE